MPRKTNLLKRVQKIFMNPNNLLIMLLVCLVIIVFGLNCRKFVTEGFKRLGRRGRGKRLNRENAQELGDKKRAKQYIENFKLYKDAFILNQKDIANKPNCSGYRIAKMFINQGSKLRDEHTQQTANEAVEAARMSLRERSAQSARAVEAVEDAQAAADEAAQAAADEAAQAAAAQAAAVEAVQAAQAAAYEAAQAAAYEPAQGARMILRARARSARAALTAAQVDRMILRVRSSRSARMILRARSARAVEATRSVEAARVAQAAQAAAVEAVEAAQAAADNVPRYNFQLYKDAYIRHQKDIVMLPASEQSCASVWENATRFLKQDEPMLAGEIIIN